VTRELSALLDDELESCEEPALWAALRANRQLSGCWQEYQLIGAALRTEENLASDITAHVMHGLLDEPVVLAPRAQAPRNLSSTLMALAASVAGVVIVGRLAVLPQKTGTDVVRLVAQTPRVIPAAPQNMQEYILAHQANAPDLSFQGGAQHVRTVSAMSNDK
jgi:sigma-E factor negative regulatory protein RseA